MEAIEPCGAVVERSTAVMSGFTLIAPEASSSMACGYSPEEAQEPCRRIWRVTTFCRWILTSGAMLPTSVTVPPLRTESMLSAMVSVRPTASRTASTPLPLVSLRTCAARLDFGIENFGGAEIFCHFEAGVVDVGDEDAIGAGGAERLKDEEADHAGADDERGFAVIDRSDLYGVKGDGGGFEHGGFGEGKIVGKAMDDARGDDDVFGEGAGAAIVAAGDAENLAIVAEIDVAAAAVGAFAAEDGGVEGDALADFEGGDAGAEGGDAAGGFVAHDEGRDAAAGGAVEAVDVAAADAAGGDFDEDFVGGGGRLGSVGDFEVVVFREEEGFHVLGARVSVV